MAGSLLGEARWGWQPLPAPAQPAAQRRALPNCPCGLTHLGWTLSPCCLAQRAQGPCSISLGGVSGETWGPSAMGKAGRGGGLDATQQDSHHRLLGSPGTGVWGQDGGWLVETCRKNRKRGLTPTKLRQEKTEKGQNEGRKGKSQLEMHVAVNRPPSALSHLVATEATVKTDSLGPVVLASDWTGEGLLYLDPGPAKLKNKTKQSKSKHHCH